MVNIKLMAFFIIYLFSGFSYSKEVKNIENLKYDIVDEGRSKVEQEGCALFRPTKEQLIDYFNQATRMDEGGSIGHQHYSPCITTGKVTFEDGNSVSFTLQSSGFTSGNFGNKEAIYFFHKDNKWYDPFECTYAMGDEAEPGCD